MVKVRQNSDSLIINLWFPLPSSIPGIRQLIYGKLTNILVNIFKSYIFIRLTVLVFA